MMYASEVISGKIIKFDKMHEENGKSYENNEKLHENDGELYEFDGELHERDDRRAGTKKMIKCRNFLTLYPQTHFWVNKTRTLIRLERKSIASLLCCFTAS